MFKDTFVIDICMQCHHLRVSQFVRGNGRFCADVTAMDPNTEATYKKSVSSKDELKLEQKLESTKKELYGLIRGSFLKCQLLTGPLTLKNYLELDFLTLKERWPAAYGQKEYLALEQYADALTCDLNECVDVDAFIGPLNFFGLKRETELAVLRMLSDIIDELIRLGLYVHKNPIADYYRGAKAHDNRKKKENRHPACMALSDCAMIAIFDEYREKYLTDARYFAVPLRALGLSTAQIAALNIGDFFDSEGMYTLPVRNQMIRPKERYIRAAVSSEWESRLLPMNWLWSDIEQWIKQYADMGISDKKKIPLCAYGCRRHPKRCTPQEIEEFLRELLNRHTMQVSELRPAIDGASQLFHNVSSKITSQALHESFLVAGSTLLGENPFFARYLLGQPAETIDEKNYLDFTSVRIQTKMNDLILQIFSKMKRGLDGNDEREMD